MTDLTDIAITIVVAASTKRSGTLTLQCSYLARPKTQDARTLTGLVRLAHCFVLAITHMNCKVGRGHMNYHVRKVSRFFSFTSSKRKILASKNLKLERIKSFWLIFLLTNLKDHERKCAMMQRLDKLVTLIQKSNL